jgi:hypothetical protein
VQGVHQKKEYQGERIGNMFAEWLQVYPKHPSRQRIINITHAIQRITEYSQDFDRRNAENFEIEHRRKPTDKEITALGLVDRHTAPWQARYEERDEMREQLNALLSFYAGGYTGLSAVDEAGQGYFSLYGRDNSKAKPDEWVALNHVMYLSSHGLLHRVRQCGNSQCRRWFYGRFDSQDCCTLDGNRCRIKKYRSSEKWKKHHREKARKRYHAKKRLQEGK